MFHSLNIKPKTKKQEVEEIIKDSMIDMLIDRLEVFRKSLREKKTSIRVSKQYSNTTLIKDNEEYKIAIPESIFDSETLNYEEKVSYIKNSLKLLLGASNESYGMEDKYNYKDYELEYGKDEELESYSDKINYDCKVVEPKEKEDKPESNPSCDDECLIPGYSDYIGEDNLIYEFQDNEPDNEDKEAQEQEFNFSRWINETELSDEKHKLSKSIANRLIQSFKGREGKEKTIVASKKINTKALFDELNDKIYLNTKASNGKNLGKVNIIVDTSGSMTGYPIENAIMLCLVFNEIARQGYCNGNIIFSQSRSRAIQKMPVKDNVLRKCIKVRNAEGLKSTIEEYKDELVDANNICCTDGDITDGEINLKKYKGVEIIGVYVTKTDEPETFNGSLSKWFNKSLVRSDISSLVQKLVHLGLRAKG